MTSTDQEIVRALTRATVEMQARTLARVMGLPYVENERKKRGIM